MTESAAMPQDDDEATDDELKSVTFGCLTAIGIVLATVTILVVWVC